MSVTTIIVTYNRKDDLCRCIEAVLAQTVVPDNLLIVNNASTDNTENFLYEKFGNPVDKKRMDGIIFCFCKVSIMFQYIL